MVVIECREGRCGTSISRCRKRASKSKNGYGGPWVFHACMSRVMSAEICALTSIQVLMNVVVVFIACFHWLALLQQYSHVGRLHEVGLSRKCCLCGEVGIASGPRIRSSDIDHAGPRAPPWAETCGCSWRCDVCPFANNAKAVADVSH